MLLILEGKAKCKFVALYFQKLDRASRQEEVIKLKNELMNKQQMKK